MWTYHLGVTIQPTAVLLYALLSNKKSSLNQLRKRDYAHILTLIFSFICPSYQAESFRLFYEQAS